MEIGEPCIYVDDSGKEHHAIIASRWRLYPTSIGVVYAEDIIGIKDGIWPFGEIKVRVATIYQQGMTGNYIKEKSA